MSTNIFIFRVIDEITKGTRKKKKRKREWTRTHQKLVIVQSVGFSPEKSIFRKSFVNIYEACNYNGSVEFHSARINITTACVEIRILHVRVDRFDTNRLGFRDVARDLNRTWNEIDRDFIRTRKFFDEVYICTFYFRTFFVCVCVYFRYFTYWRSYTRLSKIVLII